MKVFSMKVRAQDEPPEAVHSDLLIIPDLETCCISAIPADRSYSYPMSEARMKYVASRIFSIAVFWCSENGFDILQPATIWRLED